MKIKQDCAGVPSIHSHSCFLKAQWSEWVRRKRSMSLLLRSFEVTIFWKKKRALGYKSEELGPSLICATACRVTVIKSLTSVVPIPSAKGRVWKCRCLWLAGGFPETISPTQQSWQYPVLSSQCLSSYPFIPAITARASQLRAGCGLFEKPYGIPVQPRVQSQGETIVHSSGPSDILYARITLD